MYRLRSNGKARFRDYLYSYQSEIHCTIDSVRGQRKSLSAYNILRETSISAQVCLAQGKLAFHFRTDNGRI
jgi:hypothetical protein